jgi:hypothetical protein
MKINFVILVISLTLLCSKTFGQDKDITVTGRVSFVTSANVYVKFESTSAINIGDTLTFSSKKTPCLIVQNKSSISLVCTPIFNCDLKKDDAVYFNYTVKVDEKIAVENPKPVKSIEKSFEKPTVKEEIDLKSRENIRGKVSIASYSNLSSTSADRHRMMYLFSMDAQHINNSKLSFESYINYRQYLKTKETSAYQSKNSFNIYNLALKYDVDPTFSLTLGRKINNKTSSLGAIDGLQAEKYFGKNYVGIIAGFRPDINDYGFNSKLLEYGGYIGRAINNKSLYSQTTLGLLQQTNNGQIDRRYGYFQHSSTILKKLNLFSSLEFDLYNKVDTIAKNSINLTNLYVSARYKFSRKFNLMLSYDSRKRILYYETYQTEIERLLNDNEARQGVRMRMNIKPAKNIYSGFSYSKRFQSSNQNKSDNINGYVSWSNIPQIGGRFSLNYNNNKSDYMQSSIISLSHSRELIRNKLSADFYFRKVDYDYFNNNATSKQNYYGTNLSLSLGKTLRLDLSGEVSAIPGEKNDYRINTRLIKRFKNKRKK